MFKGSITALVTPFKNGELDVKSFENFIEFQISNGTSGLVPGGTTGESPTLDYTEHKKIIDTKVNAICVFNKVDQVQNKNELLPIIQEIDAQYSFMDYVPISALKNEGIDDLLVCIKNALPENNHLYPAESEEKEMPDNFFISELVREKIIRSLGDELPLETYVVVWTESPWKRSMPSKTS